MLDFLFFVKTLAVTLLICVLLQIKIGGTTLENHTVQFIETSAFTQPLHEAADGGVKVVRQSMAWLSKQANMRWKSFRKGGGAATSERSLGIDFNRSEAYQKKHEGHDSNHAPQNEE